jgi:hypothetical protein
LIDFDKDDTATLLPSSGGKRLLASPSGKVSSTKGCATITSSTVDTPKFKRLSTAFETDDLEMLHIDIMNVLFSSANEEALEKMQKSYGFDDINEIRRVFLQTCKRARESNEGRFVQTSMEDPRKVPKKAVTNPADNPFWVD